MKEKKLNLEGWKVYFILVFFTTLSIIIQLSLFTPDWHQDLLFLDAFLSPLVFVLCILCLDFYRHRKKIAKFFKACVDEFNQIDRNHENEKSLKEYYNFRKYLAIYAFLGYQIIYFGNLLLDILKGRGITQSTVSIWSLFFLSIVALLFIWRPLMPKDQLMPKAIFFSVLLFIMPFIAVIIFNLPLSILIVCGLFGGMIIWVDTLYFVSHFILTERLNWSITQIYQAHVKKEFILEQLNERKKTEQTTMRYAITFYSFACVGIFVRLMDLNKLLFKADNNLNGNNFFFWAIILVAYISFGWGKGLYFQARSNRLKVIECIKKVITADTKQRSGGSAEQEESAD